MGAEMIDWAHLHGLQADIGSNTFGKVIELFLAEADETLDQLAKPEAEILRLLHMLKGISLAVGFTDLAAQCRDGERRAGAGAAPDIAAILVVYRAGREQLLAGLPPVNLAPSETLGQAC